MAAYAASRLPPNQGQCGNTRRDDRHPLSCIVRAVGDEQYSGGREALFDPSRCGALLETNIRHVRLLVIYITATALRLGALRPAVAR